MNHTVSRRVAFTFATTAALLVTGAATASAEPLPLSNPLHQRAGHTVTSDAHGDAHAVAQCPDGYYADAGGYAVSSYAATVYTNRTTTDGTGWEVFASERTAHTSEPFQLKAYAECSLL